MTPEQRRMLVAHEVSTGMTWMYEKGREDGRRATIDLIRRQSETLAIRLAPDLRMLLDDIAAASPFDEGSVISR